MRSPRGSLRGDIPASTGLRDPPSLEALKALGQIATAERQWPGRKLLVWVGPGWDIGSGAYAERTVSKKEIFYTVCWFSTLLREARVVLNSLSVGETNPSQYYLDYLNGVQSIEHASFMNLYRKVLAVQSGGQVLNRSYDLVGQIESCVRQASAFYTLSFDPPPARHQDEYHDLKIQIDKPGMIARTNTGYYDQPYYSDRPNPLDRTVSSEQLEKLLSAIHSQSDAKVARQLSGLALTDRLSSTKLASWRTSLHGKRAQQELTALADASAFQGPSPSDIAHDPQPDAMTQQQILALATDYLKKTIPKLPNFYAKRTTVRYEDRPQLEEGSGSYEYQPLNMAEIAETTVLYRPGTEVVDSSPAKHKSPQRNDWVLITYGTFGPILELAKDILAVPGSLTWSHWEQDSSRKRAVFSYTVPLQRSRYHIWGCCLPDGNGTNGFDIVAGFHGEVSIEPTTGAIVRMEAKADLQGFVPLLRSDVVVEYGPVEIGGKTYIVSATWSASCLPEVCG